MNSFIRQLSCGHEDFGDLLVITLAARRRVIWCLAWSCVWRGGTEAAGRREAGRREAVGREEAAGEPAGEESGSRGGEEEGEEEVRRRRVSPRGSEG